MNKTYTVIAVTYGSGEELWNNRVWSHTFNTHAAADIAARTIREATNSNCTISIVEDSNE